MREKEGEPGEGETKSVRGTLRGRGGGGGERERESAREKGRETRVRER